MNENPVNEPEVSAIVKLPLLKQSKVRMARASVCHNYCYWVPG